MKSIYVNQANPGDELINELFLLSDVVQRKTRDGRPFVLCTLRDRTGQINGVYWDIPDYVNALLRPGIPVLISGQVNNYKNALQVNITDANIANNIDASELLPASQRPIEEMIAELHEFIDSLNEPWKTLVSGILLDQDVLMQYANAPAARVMHHAYIGGLLEHTLTMAKTADFLTGVYPYINRDLLLSGVLLHDFGKTKEYAFNDEFGFTEDGRMVGHIVRAIVTVELAAAQMDFPEDDLRQLIHLIASHHGTLEWGSPVVPRTIEAVLLHQIDLLDSRMQGFYDHLRNDSGEGAWTTKNSPMHGTELKIPPEFQSE
ncbi:MAG: 3'-5' exoribonuclease YhaM family protein [Candidatus Promineifilaceae bacterium]